MYWCHVTNYVISCGKAGPKNPTEYSAKIWCSLAFRLTPAAKYSTYQKFCYRSLKIFKQSVTRIFLRMFLMVSLHGRLKKSVAHLPFYLLLLFQFYANLIYFHKHITGKHLLKDEHILYNMKSFLKRKRKRKEIDKKSLFYHIFSHACKYLLVQKKNLFSYNSTIRVAANVISFDR